MNVTRGFRGPSAAAAGALAAVLAVCGAAMGQTQPKALLIADGYLPADYAARARLESSGFDVTSRPGWLIAPWTSLGGYDLIVLSGSSYTVSTTALNRIEASGTPIFVVEPWDFLHAYRLGLTTVPDMACNWSAFMDVIDDTHPISSGFSGAEFLYSYPSLVCGAGAWSLASGVRPLFNSERWPLVQYPAVIVDSSRKIVASGVYSTGAYSDRGWQLFDEIICYLTGVCPEACADFDASTYSSVAQVEWGDTIEHPTAPLPGGAPSQYLLVSADVNDDTSTDGIYLSCSDASGSVCTDAKVPVLKPPPASPTEYCSESDAPLGSWEDCAGTQHEVVRTTYSPVTDERAATVLGCQEVPGMLPPSECQALSLPGTGQVDCTVLPEEPPVDPTSSADYQQCIAQGQDPALCAIVAQDCVTVVECPDDARLVPADSSAIDPVESDVAIDPAAEDNLYDIPPAPVPTDDYRQVYACDLASRQAEERRGGLEDGESSQRFDYKKGSTKWNVGFSAGYRANNGWQRGPFAEGGEAGLDLAFDAEMFAHIFGIKVPLAYVDAEAGAHLCGLDGAYDVKIFDSYVIAGTGTGSASFPGAALSASCLDLLAQLQDAQDRLNKTLWTYRIFAEYWNEQGDASGIALLPAIDGPTPLPETSIDRSDVLAAYEAYAQAVAEYQSIAETLAGVVEQIFTDSQYAVDIVQLGETAASPEVQQSIPIGPFAVTLAGQAAGHFSADVDAQLGVELETLPDVRLPLPSPMLGMGFVPAVDVGGWIFAGVGLDIGIGGAALGIRGELTLLDLELPVDFGFAVTPVDNPVARGIDWNLEFARAADAELAILDGKIDAELRVWIKLLFAKIKKSFRKNITHWDGFHYAYELDRGADSLGRLVTTPYFLDNPLIDITTLTAPDGSPMLAKTLPPERSTQEANVVDYPVSSEEWAVLIRTVQRIGTDLAWSMYEPPGVPNPAPDEVGFCQPPPPVIP